MRTVRTLALLGVAAVLAGCQAGVTTNIAVQGNGDADVTATVTFVGEAADLLESDNALDTQIQDLLKSRAGVGPERTFEDGTLTYTVGLDYQNLMDSKDVLGIESATVESVNEDDATLTVNLVEPTALGAAIIQQAATQEDREALAETMLRTTLVSVRAEFAGGITQTSGTYDAARSEDAVTVEQELFEYQPGTLIVQGDPTESLVSRYGLPVGIGAGVVLLAGFVLVSRRRALSREA